MAMVPLMAAFRGDFLTQLVPVDDGDDMATVAAKVAHLGLLPQGQPERYDRVRKMVGQMDAEGFGHCTNHYECMAACPKGIDVEFIARMNRDLIKAMVTSRDDVAPRKKG